MLTLSYRIALLLSFSFFQYVKDRYLIDYFFIYYLLFSFRNGLVN